MNLDNQETIANPLKPLDILEGLSQFPAGATLSEICSVTNLNKSSTYRILNALIDKDYVSRNDSTKTYKLTYKILSISSAVLDTIEIKKIARTQLLKLSEITGETIHLISKDGYEGLYIDKIDTPNTIGLKSQVGKHIPLYCTSGGKVLLAYSSPAFVQRYLDTVELERWTAKTITDKLKLIEELEIIKQQGYAVDDEEHHDDITCISVPIFNKDKSVEASISIAAPSFRFSLDLAKSFMPAMKRYADEITQNMPY